MNCFEMLSRLLEKYSLEDISNKLFIHKGTVKRWLESKKVPNNYFNDLNSLLGNIYESSENFNINDQYYTKEKVAVYCINKLYEFLKFHIKKEIMI